MASCQGTLAVGTDHDELHATDTYKEYYRPQADTGNRQLPGPNNTHGETSNLDDRCTAAARRCETPPIDGRQDGLICRNKKSTGIILAGCLLLVAAIVGGTLGGLRAHNSPPRETASTASSTYVPTSTSGTAAASSTSVPVSAWNASNSSLASVAWTGEDGLGYRRLYHQDSAGVIRESAWNSSGQEWRLSDVALAKAKPSSPLAAAVVGTKNFTFVCLGAGAFDHSSCLAELTPINSK
ncbi:MAG: hypothetical protein Q9219_000090 [cf. Caloplaca sp. 3 TL-2023]